MAAQEAAAKGTEWVFAPMVDICREPRWGRIAEGAGEDPNLGCLVAAARVRGFQSVKHVAACPKHYVAYGAVEAGRDYNSVDVSERALRDVYLPPFKAAFDAGAETVMTSFNEIAGVPAAVAPFRSTYVDEPNAPLFPFGFGLSYTVTNMGRRSGTEVVQLYVRDVVGSVRRPVRELKAFERVSLEPGESRSVRFEVQIRSLGFTGLDMRYRVEPGEFRLWIGPDSASGLEGTFFVN